MAIIGLRLSTVIEIHATRNLRPVEDMNTPSSTNKGGVRAVILLRMHRGNVKNAKTYNSTLNERAYFKMHADTTQQDLCRKNVHITICCQMNTLPKVILSTWIIKQSSFQINILVDALKCEDKNNASCKKVWYAQHHASGMKIIATIIKI